MKKLIERLLSTAEAPPPTEAWKRENAKYLAWFDNQHPTEHSNPTVELEDFLRDWKNDWKKLGWNALIPAVPLVVLVVGVLYSILH
jgi:hypothetical protein